MKVILFSAIFALAAGSAAKAEEGFNLAAPAFLKNAWNNSVWIEMKANKAGGHHSASGTILREQKIGGKNYLFVLTAGHIASALDWPAHKIVVPSGNFASPRLFTNTHIPQRATVAEGRAAVVPAGTSTKDSPPVALKFVWGYLSTAPDTSSIDAGLLVFEEEHRFPDLVPLHFAHPKSVVRGEDVFQIGFPAVALRAESAQTVKIPNKDVMTKRFSHGQFVGGISPASDNGVAMLGATNDVLLGSSGGAIFNQHGDIIGVVSLMYSSEIEAWAYLPDAPFSVGFFDTAALSQFVEDKINIFVKTVSTKMQH